MGKGQKEEAVSLLTKSDDGRRQEVDSAGLAMLHRRSSATSG